MADSADTSDKPNYTQIHEMLLDYTNKFKILKSSFIWILIFWLRTEIKDKSKGLMNFQMDSNK